MVVSEPSGETEANDADSNKETNDETDSNVIEENNQNLNNDDSVPSNTQDTDSGIEVKAAINEPAASEENKENKDESSDDANGSSTADNDAFLKSPESLQALSDRAVRMSSSSVENEGEVTNTEDDESGFANFQNAFSKGWLTLRGR